MPACGAMRGDVLRRIRAVAADELESQRRDASPRPRAKASTSVGTWRRLKIEPTNSTSGSRDGGVRSRRPDVDAMRDHADAIGWNAQVPDDLAARELRDREHRLRALRGRRAPAARRRQPSRGRNHSGCAANDTSCMATTSGIAVSERRRCSRARRSTSGRSRRTRRGERALLPARAAGAGHADDFAWQIRRQRDRGVGRVERELVCAGLAR